MSPLADDQVPIAICCFIAAVIDPDACLSWTHRNGVHYVECTTLWDWANRDPNNPTPSHWMAL